MVTKKIFTVMLVVFSLTAVAAAQAQAFGPPLYSGETAVATGTAVVGSSVGVVEFKAGGTTVATCSSATVPGTVAKNSSGDLKINMGEWKFTGTGSEGRCVGAYFNNFTATLSSSTCLRHSIEMATGESQYSAKSCSEAPGQFQLTIDSSNGGKCLYQRASGNAWTWTSTLNTSPLQLNTKVAKFTLAEGPVFCPTYLELPFHIRLNTSAGAELKLVE